MSDMPASMPWRWLRFLAVVTLFAGGWGILAYADAVLRPFGLLAMGAVPFLLLDRAEFSRPRSWREALCAIALSVGVLAAAIWLRPEPGANQEMARAFLRSPLIFGSVVTLFAVGVGWKMFRAPKDKSSAPPVLQ